MTDEGFSVLSNIASCGTSKVIGITEIKWLPIVSLTDYTITAIYHYGVQFITIFRSRNLRQQFTTIPATELPWYPLVLSIFKALRLPDVVTSCSKRFGRQPTICYKSPEAASTYLGILSFDVIHTIHPMMTVARLSHYDNH